MVGSAGSLFAARRALDAVGAAVAAPLGPFLERTSRGSLGAPSKEEAAMARQKSVTRKQSRSKRDAQQNGDHGKSQNGHEEEVARYEQELVGVLQERIKPGLNSGSIPLLARSIAKDIARRELPNGASEHTEVEDEADDEFTDEADDGPSDQVDDEFTDEADDEPSDEADEELEDEPSEDADDEYDDEEENVQGEAVEPPPEFEADMKDLQAELGEDWILRFSVQGDDAWLTAEKDDGSQRVETPYASVLTDAVDLLNESGGRST